MGISTSHGQWGLPQGPLCHCAIIFGAVSLVAYFCVCPPLCCTYTMWCHLGGLSCACHPFRSRHTLYSRSVTCNLTCCIHLFGSGCASQFSLLAQLLHPLGLLSQYTLATIHCHCTLPFNWWHYVLRLSSLDWLCCWHSVIHWLIHQLSHLVVFWCLQVPRQFASVFVVACLRTFSSRLSALLALVLDTA